MIGFPKTLNSRQDVDNCMALYPEQTKAYLQTLIDNRFALVVSGELAEGDPGVEDATHKVVSEDRDGQEVRTQMELIEDPGAALFRLGLTVAEAEATIESPDPGV